MTITIEYNVMMICSMTSYSVHWLDARRVICWLQAATTQPPGWSFQALDLPSALHRPYPLVPKDRGLVPLMTRGFLGHRATPKNHHPLLGFSMKSTIQRHGGTLSVGMPMPESSVVWILPWYSNVYRPGGKPLFFVGVLNGFVQLHQNLFWYMTNIANSGSHICTRPTHQKSLQIWYFAS